MIRHPAGSRHWTKRKPELIRRGVKSHAAKLSADDIATLYRFADSGWHASELAGHFDVSRVTGVTHVTFWALGRAKSLDAYGIIGVQVLDTLAPLTRYLEGVPNVYRV